MSGPYIYIVVFVLFLGVTWAVLSTPRLRSSFLGAESVCGEGYEELNGMCWKKCGENEDAIGNICREKCVGGKELEGVCWKPCKEGDQDLGAMCRERCRQGSKDAGLCWSGCNPGDKNLGALCREKCRDGFRERTAGLCSGRNALDRVYAPKTYAKKTYAPKLYPKESQKLKTTKRDSFYPPENDANMESVDPGSVLTQLISTGEEGPSLGLIVGVTVVGLTVVGGGGYYYYLTRVKAR